MRAFIRGEAGLFEFLAELDDLITGKRKRISMEMDE
jgi:hypothetical protein